MQYEEFPVDNIICIQSLFTFFRRVLPYDFHFNGESHDFMEVVCVIGGRVGVTADKNLFILSAGQLIIHPANEFHTIWSDNAHAEVVIFSFRANDFPLPEKRVFTLNTEQITLLCNLHKRAKTVFSFSDIHVTGIWARRDAEAAILIKQLEIFLLNTLTSENPPMPVYSSQSAENYVRIVNAMEDSLGGPLNMQRLADRCNLSVSAVERTMRRYMGCGAIAFFNILRMKRAVTLLEEGKSVKEVAYLLGFSCQNYFSSAFKKWAKKSPSAFRK